MGERLAGGNVAIALLANPVATGAMLVTLILTSGPISGAHFNPAVTLADASQGGLAWRDVPGYLLAQLLGAFAGVAAAHVMFGEPVFSASRHVRAGGATTVQSAVRHLGLCSIALLRCAVRGRRIYNGGVLVHRVNVVRQPGGHARHIGKRYIRRNPAGGRTIRQRMT